MRIPIRCAASIVLIVIGVGLSAPAMSEVCDTEPARSVLDARENAKARKQGDLQDEIDNTTGDIDPTIVSDNCVTDVMSEGLGASISLPTLGDIVGDVADRAVDAFCDVVDSGVDAVDDGIDEATDPVDDAPGVDVDAGVGEDNEVAADNDVTDAIGDRIEDGVIDRAEDEVLDGLY